MVSKISKYSKEAACSFSFNLVYIQEEFLSLGENKALNMTLQ